MCLLLERAGSFLIRIGDLGIVLIQLHILDLLHDFHHFIAVVPGFQDRGEVYEAGGNITTHIEVRYLEAASSFIVLPEKHGHHLIDTDSLISDWECRIGVGVVKAEELAVVELSHLYAEEHFAVGESPTKREKQIAFGYIAIAVPIDDLDLFDAVHLEVVLEVSLHELDHGVKFDTLVDDLRFIQVRAIVLWMRAGVHQVLNLLVRVIEAFLPL